MNTTRNSFKLTMAVLAMLALAACTTATPPMPATPTPTETHEDAIIRQLAAKYQAILLWEQNITYTLQAQERLTTGKPTLFTGGVEDIFHRNGKTFVRFSDSGAWTSFVFELECSPSMANTILTANPSSDDYPNDYVVVANIREVSRPIVVLRASPLSEEEAEIEMASSYTPFIARGTCIDVALVRAD